MSAHSTLDPESFQSLLASAFVVQESQMDVQSRSAMVEVRRLIMAGKLDVNGAMYLIADRARNVANADGVAIGLLKGDQLVYWAGSGSAATYIGRHVMATLSISAKAGASHEILRVEDSDTDARIEAAICRQFGAKSLLILPIYQEPALAGVLEIFFSQAHSFQAREVCTYELMARLVGEAMSHAVLLQQKKARAAELETTAQAIERVRPRVHNFLKEGGSPANEYATCPSCGATIDDSKKLPPRGPILAAAAPTMIRRAERPSLEIRWWKVADRAAVVVVLVIASWIAYTYRRPAFPLRVVTRPRPSAIEQHLPSMPTELEPTTKEMSTPQTASVPLKHQETASRRTSRRVRVGNDEIDYVSEDVTVRHFTRKPALRQARIGDYQVDYISEDVTVRHFTPKLAIMPPKPR